MSKSNNNGRVLEYLIVDYIIKKFGSKVSLSKNTIREQERDFQKLSDIKSEVLENMKVSSEKISKWLNEEVKENSFLVERLVDGEGTKGDVTDIRITVNGEKLNLSIKHNHLALKHQRPGPTPQHFDFPKGSVTDKEFRTKYSENWLEFRKNISNINSNVKLYKEIDSHVFELLYLPMCTLVSEFINTHGTVKERSDYYLKFLVGNTNFKKIIVYPDSKIFIKSYDNIPVSLKITSTVVKKNHIEVDFHNGIVLDMRLHTASSRYSQNSLKFDTQSKEFDVSTIEL